MTFATVDPLPFDQRVRVERLFEQRAEIGKVRREAEIFLGDLEFHHQRRLRHRAEQRMERFARLEIDGAVLHLHEHVVGELAVERHEFVDTPAWRDRSVFSFE